MGACGGESLGLVIDLVRSGGAHDGSARHLTLGPIRFIVRPLARQGADPLPALARCLRPHLEA